MTSIPYIICKTFISMLIVSTLTTTATTTKHVYNIYIIYIYIYVYSESDIFQSVADIPCIHITPLVYKRELYY